MSDVRPQPVQRRSSDVIPHANSEPLPRWIDWLVLAVTLVVAATAIFYTVQVGAFNVSLTDDALWSWHLIRACGLVAYALLTGSTLWGIFLSSRVIKDWSPGALSLLLHSATSWLAIVFAGIHGILLLFDTYYQFQPSNLLIPFTGPYRPIPVGLGVIGLYLLVVISISFNLRRWIGNRAWRLVHYLSYAAFVLITVHVLLAGTDAVQPGMRIVLGIFAFTVTALVLVRIGRAVGVARQLG